MVPRVGHSLPRLDSLLEVKRGDRDGPLADPVRQPVREVDPPSGKHVEEAAPVDDSRSECGSRYIEMKAKLRILIHLGPNLKTKIHSKALT